MKKDKKLTLNKQTVSKLTGSDEIKGGVLPTIIIVVTSFATCRSECFCGGGGDTPPVTRTNCVVASCKLKCN